MFPRDVRNSFKKEFPFGFDTVCSGFWCFLTTLILCGFAGIHTNVFTEITSCSDCMPLHSFYCGPRMQRPNAASKKKTGSLYHAMGYSFHTRIRTHVMQQHIEVHMSNLEHEHLIHNSRCAMSHLTKSQYK